MTDQDLCSLCCRKKNNLLIVVFHSISFAKLKRKLVNRLRAKYETESIIIWLVCIKIDKIPEKKITKKPTEDANEQIASTKANNKKMLFIRQKRKPNQVSSDKRINAAIGERKKSPRIPFQTETSPTKED